MVKFDIDRYLARVGRLDDSSIDYGHFRSNPLDPSVLQCLRYMHDVEAHTTCYLRDLLVTSAHDDPEITAFLAMWAYEEHWHGEALAKVLAAHGESHGRSRVVTTRRRVGRDRLRTLGFMGLSGITDHVVTIAMTWGAVNEWTTQAGYVRLSEISGDAVLGDLLRRIARQEGMHIDFYASQAETRLAESAAGRRITRAALRNKWKPVGSNIVERGAPERLVRTLFGGHDGRRMAQRVDRRISSLPGLDGLMIIDRARDRAMDALDTAA